jgi:hypothetical protein
MATNADLRPHLFPGEQELMEKEFRRASSYLEFGTGGSTVLAFESGLKRIVTADSDPVFLDKVRAIARTCLESDIDFVFCDLGPTGEWGNPVGRDNIINWPQYFTLPWHHFLARNEVPDLIYIDGRFRVACALYSILILHVKCNRWLGRKSRLMIHDFLRPEYSKVKDYAKVVSSANTLAVLEPKKRISADSLVRDLLVFQFDTR